MRIRWLTSALVSLRSVHRYIAADNPNAARNVVLRIEKSIERLRTFPLSGRVGIVPGTRELVISGLPYIVVYTVRESDVMIMRIFHTKQQRH